MERLFAEIRISPPGSGPGGTERFGRRALTPLGHDVQEAGMAKRKRRRSGQRLTWRRVAVVVALCAVAAALRWYFAPPPATLEDLPPYSGSPYTELAGNVPSFDQEDLTTDSYEWYSELDLLGRCGTAQACVGQDLMPTESRGDISDVQPTGWEQNFYDFVSGQALYNRCHLIGFQLTGENDNPLNLITGTRYLNVEGMLPFENEVADYVEQTGNHVLYRVTPLFEGTELVARGVEMEALSVEDQGLGVCFHVFCYNVQPGVDIDYQTGENWEMEEAA